jgi:hypothetical protein
VLDYGLSNVTFEPPNHAFTLLGLEETFNGSCFGHVFSKACQYGTAKKKVCKDMRFMLIKNALLG